MGQNAAPADPSRPLAREMRAARAYSGMSREQLARALQVEKQTIGRYERGEWVTPPRLPAVEALASATGIPDDARARLLAALEQTRREYFDVELGDYNTRREVAAMGDDSATSDATARRFAERAEREAARQRERPGSDSASRPGEGAEGEGS